VDQVQIELRVTDDRDALDDLDPVEDPFVVRREEVDAAPGLHRTEVERFREALDVACEVGVNVRVANEWSHQRRAGVKRQCEQGPLSSRLGGELLGQFPGAADKAVERLATVLVEAVILRPEVQEGPGLRKPDGATALVDEVLLLQRIDDEMDCPDADRCFAGEACQGPFLVGLIEEDAGDAGRLRREETPEPRLRPRWATIAS
jgi:hypothetical protein